MRSLERYIGALFVTVAILLMAQPAFAYVQVRISIKFILDANGNRPPTGNLDQDPEIYAEVDAGNTILSDNKSELRLQLLELIDVSGISTYYALDATGTTLANLRADATSNPTAYSWRTDAINIYINGESGGISGGISNFPGNHTNDIILINQDCANNPSCILHELGHSLNLMHTHETCCGFSFQDECQDTISDDNTWTRDQIAQNNFGTTYANLTSDQQDQVDLVFNNVMSYHVSEPQRRLSFCQMDRMSTQSDDDRAWLLTREAVYVDGNHAGTQDGRFNTPYQTLLTAMAAGLGGKVTVLQQGHYATSGNLTINVDTQLVPRFGTVTVGDGVHLYDIPTNFEDSESPEVRDAIREVQAEDTKARKAKKEAEQSIKKATSAEEKAAIAEIAKAENELHSKNAMNALRKAAKFAPGEEKVAIEMEIAQRLRDSGDCGEAIKFFNLAADDTGQIHLRERALLEVKKCQTLLEKSEK